MKKFQMDAQAELNKLVQEVAVEAMTEEEQEFYHAKVDEADAMDFRCETDDLREKFLEIVGKSATLPGETWTAEAGSSLDLVFRALQSMEQNRKDERARSRAEPWIERAYWLERKMHWETMIKHASFLRGRGRLPHQRQPVSGAIWLLIATIIGLGWLYFG